MKVLVTGADGLVGSAIRRAAGNNHRFTFANRNERCGYDAWDVDLIDGRKVAAMFSRVQPDAVIHTAAFCGGIGQQGAAPFDLVHQNLLMNCNVIEQCLKHDVKRLLAFSSVCAYPDGKLDSGLVETDLHDRQPPLPNWHYGYAKRMVDVLIDGAMRQHGTRNWCSVVPVNIYGPNDNYRLGVCHVVPALIHKLYLARKSGEPLRVWGDGSPLREFLYADDLAKVLLRLLDLDEVPQRLIVSPGEQRSIKELVTELMLATVHNSGLRLADGIEWQKDKPNGQHARPTDTSLLKRLLPDLKWTPLRDGLRQSYEWFSDNYETCRK